MNFLDRLADKLHRLLNYPLECLFMHDRDTETYELGYNLYTTTRCRRWRCQKVLKVKVEPAWSFEDLPWG
jgi:hypothetical protein